MKPTNVDKIYWPQDKITKGDLLHYYESISSFILPYLKNRPLVMHRFPDGITGESFYQKEAGEHLPSFIKTFSIRHEERKVSYIVVQNLESLLYVVNLGSIELHPFNASLKHLHNPDYMVFDLDPEDIAFDRVIDTAQAIHELLDSLKIPNYCKTSGATGLHIYVPLHCKYDFQQVQQIMFILASKVHDKIPDFTSLERSPKKRQKKVYIDYLQNREMQTVVCAYSVRAKPHATVSTPLDWKEVKYGLNPADFTIKTVPERVNGQKDLFKAILGKGINLETLLKKLDKGT